MMFHDEDDEDEVIKRGEKKQQLSRSIFFFVCVLCETGFGVPAELVRNVIVHVTWIIMFGLLLFIELEEKKVCIKKKTFSFSSYVCL